MILVCGWACRSSAAVDDRTTIREAGASVDAMLNGIFERRDVRREECKQSNSFTEL